MLRTLSFLLICATAGASSKSGECASSGQCARSSRSLIQTKQRKIDVRVMESEDVNETFWQCWCTGKGNQYQCSNWIKAHCAVDEECYSPYFPYGHWSKGCRKITAAPTPAPIEHEGKAATCSFESGFGIWSNFKYQQRSPAVDWVIRSDSTSSDISRPIQAADGSQFAYVDTSVKGWATLAVSGLAIGALHHDCTFKYKVCGSGDLSLRFIQVPPNGADHEVWTAEKADDECSSWKAKTIKLCTTRGGVLHPTGFQARLGPGSTGYVAVDDVRVSWTGGYCGGK